MSAVMYHWIHNPDIHTLQSIGLEEGIAEVILRTKSGKLELRFDDDIADFVIANVEAAWRLRSVFTSMQELEERLVEEKLQASDLESLEKASMNDAAIE
jgi:hypothetical protein